MRYLITIFFSFFVLNAFGQYEYLDQASKEKLMKIRTENRNKALQQEKESTSIFSISPVSSQLHSEALNNFPDKNETGEWIGWFNGEIASSIGTGDIQEISIASRFTPDDLLPYAGLSITQVRFLPFDQADFTFKVWQGSDEPTEIYSQEVGDFFSSQFKTIELEEPLPIDPTQELWFGFNIQLELGSFPLAIDSGPGATGKGDLYKVDSLPWVSLEETSGISANWIIEAFAEQLNEDVPEMPQNFTALAGDQGELSTSLSWETPSLSLAGNPLTELISVVLLRDGQIIQEFTDVSTGETLSYTDNDITESGFYKYQVYAVNSEGQGISSSSSVFIGTDIPLAPENVVLETDEDVNAFLSWDAPQEGINQGYINSSSVVYDVVRFPDQVEVAAGLNATQFTDETITLPGNYQYVVTARNDEGIGQSAQSNTIFLGGSENILFYDAFNYESETIPLGWELDNFGFNWVVLESNGAGGSAPELVLSWNGSSEGDGRMKTPVFNLNGATYFRVEFLQYMENFQTSFEDILSLEYTIDEGTTWNTIWEEQVVADDIPQGLYEFLVTVPEGTESMQLAFRFQGDPFNINFWFIDELVVEELTENDLMLASLEGMSTSSVGLESEYNVTVINRGQNVTSDYEVVFRKTNGEVLGTQSGVNLESGQSQSFAFTWIPSEEGEISLEAEVQYDADEVQGNNVSQPLNVLVLPEGTLVANVGESQDYPLNQAPFNFFWKTSLAQSIYYPEELGVNGGAITNIEYYNSFASGLMQKPVKIWMGETDQSDLSGGFVDPSTLTLVFDGTVDFPEGENAILLNLQQPYVYNGGNLVVYTQRVYEDQFFSGHERFFNSPDSERIRSIGLVSDDPDFYDPANPPSNQGHQMQFYPNTSFYFSLNGLGSLAGIVTDGNLPMDSVKVEIDGTTLFTYSNENGEYVFPFLSPGDYQVNFEIFGFESQNQSVTIAADETTQLDITLNAIPQFAVSGTVTGNDGNLLEGVNVALQGYSNYSTQTDSSGEFTFNDVFEGDYEITLQLSGYEPFDGQISVIGETDAGNYELIEIILSPGALQVDTDNFGPGNVQFSWNNAVSSEFRYDNGNPFSTLGFNGMYENAVLGAVHRNVAELNTISWFLNGDASTDEAMDVKLWVFGLDENGQPSISELIASVDSVSSTFGEWNSYTFDETVSAPNGFFIGISSIQPIFLNTTDGMDPEWPFELNTQFFNTDVTLNEFFPLETSGFQENFMIRATGADFGAIEFDGGNQPDDSLTTKSGGENILVSEILNSNLNTTQPQFTENSDVNKAFTGFNIFLNDMEEPFDSTTENEYLFTELAEGDYTVGVQSVYTSGASEVVTLDFSYTLPVEILVNVFANSGASAEGAVVTLSNEQFDEYVYMDTVSLDGNVFFPSVKKGSYTLSIVLDGFESFTSSGNVLQENTSLDAELIESINPPANLMVSTEGVGSGEALFSWNAEPAGFLESFEGANLPEGWTQIINNTGEFNGYASTWQIVEDLGFAYAPTPFDGDYQAYIQWSFENQDEWLISNEFTAPMGDLEFWYYGKNGSTFGDSYFVKISNDGGATWEVIWNASALPAGFNEYNEPAVIDLTPWAGQDIMLAWHADDGPQDWGLWASWAIDQIKVGDVEMNMKDFFAGSGQDTQNNFSSGVSTKSAIGYNVYLNDAMVAGEVSETEFLFTGLEEGTYTAGVEAVFVTGVSDLVTFDFEIAENYELQILTNPVDSIMVMGDGFYQPGEQVNVSANASEAFEFVNWTDEAGEIISEDPAFTYTMPANNVTLIANFVELQVFSVTMNIDVSTHSGFDQHQHEVNVTGSMHNWEVLGAMARNQTLEQHDTHVYTITFQMEPGTYQYRYFLNEGVTLEEWDTVEEREIVVDSDITLFDVWGAEQSTSVEDAVNDNKTVFPNPFTTQINITNVENISKVTFSDILGNVMVVLEDDFNTLNTKEFGSGVYFVTIEKADNTISVHKMVKN